VSVVPAVRARPLVEALAAILVLAVLATREAILSVPHQVEPVVETQDGKGGYADSEKHQDHKSGRT
jgi:hypothetical protein